MSITQTKNFNLELRTPKLSHLLGDLPVLWRGKNGCFYDGVRSVAAQGREITALRIVNQNWYLVSDAELAKEMLIGNKNSFPKGSTLDEFKAFGLAATGMTFSEGESWAGQRRALQPHFQPNAVSQRLKTSEEAVRDLVDKISDQSVHSVPDFAAQFAMQLNLKSLIADIDQRPDESLDKIIKGLIERQAFASDQIVKRIKFGRFWKYLPISSNKQVKIKTAEHSFFLKQQISRRRACHKLGTHGDFLDCLLAAKGETLLGEDHLVDQLQTFLGAGYESTASTIQWLLFRLATNQGVQDLVRQDSKAGEPESYTSSVVKEVLRLHPAFSLLLRTVANEAVAPAGPFKRGGMIFFLLELMQTRSDIWGSDSMQFRPERFAAGSLTAKQLSAFVPFGIGPRYCIANHAAMQMLTSLTVRLCKSFRIEPVGLMSEDRIFAVTMRPAQQMRVKFTVL